MKGAPMKELLFFILGITFAYVIEPLLEKIMTLILTLFDVALGKCHIQLTHQKKEIENIMEENQPQKIFPIGFATSKPIEEEMEDEEDEPESG